jgi:hypothetical protein
MAGWRELCQKERNEMLERILEETIEGLDEWNYVNGPAVNGIVKKFQRALAPAREAAREIPNIG